MSSTNWKGVTFNDNISTNPEKSQVFSVIKKIKGITSLYDWQIRCLATSYSLNRKNMLISLPTSAGKTLVAEYLILAEITVRRKNALFILPFNSLVNEKVLSLTPFAIELGFIIEIYANTKGQFPPRRHLRKHCIYIATIEKALILVNSLLEEKRLAELGLIVIDELHLIGEAPRGAVIENLILKIIASKAPIQIIGMTATIGNINEVASFMSAFPFTSEFRPTKVDEFIKIEDVVYTIDKSQTTPFKFHSVMDVTNACVFDNDPDNITSLVLEALPSYPCLIFCQTKKNCENVAKLMTINIPIAYIQSHKRQEREKFIQEVAEEDSISSTVVQCILAGIGYHHSGLLMEERKLLEEAFRQGIILVLCSTSTLAAGVNLPAKRVIIRSPFVGFELMTQSKYKQMIGRAGRAGLSEEGESYLVCPSVNAKQVAKMLCSPLDKCLSQLTGPTLFDFLLSTLHLELANSLQGLYEIVKKSLAYRQRKIEIDTLKEISTSLVTKKVLSETSEGHFKLTKFGRAVVKGGIEIESAQHLYRELVSSLRSLDLTDNLHLLYLATSLVKFSDIPFDTIGDILRDLSRRHLNLTAQIGIKPEITERLAAGVHSTITAEDTAKLKRFTYASLLNDLLRGKSVSEVSKRYSMPKGHISNILSSAAATISSIIRFCEMLPELKVYEKLLSDLPQSIYYRCSPELFNLMELPYVKAGRARMLYNAGFKTIKSLAAIKARELVKQIDRLPLKQAEEIISMAKLMMLTEANMLQEDAEAILFDLDGTEGNARKKQKT